MQNSEQMYYNHAKIQFSEELGDVCTVMNINTITLSYDELYQQINNNLELIHLLMYGREKVDINLY